MWFFENPKSLGFIFELVGFIMLFSAAVYLLGSYTEFGLTIPDDVPDKTRYCLILGIGEGLAAIIYIGNAHRVMKGVINKKIDVLSKYLITVGVTTIISKEAEALADMGTYPTEVIIAVGVLILIIGIIIIAVGKKIGNAKPSPYKNILRYILILAFFLLLIWSLYPAETYLELLNDITHLLIAIFMILFLYDPEVKVAMGGEKE